MNFLWWCIGCLASSRERARDKFFIVRSLSFHKTDAWFEIRKQRFIVIRQFTVTMSVSSHELLIPLLLCLVVARTATNVQEYQIAASGEVQTTSHDTFGVMSKSVPWQRELGFSGDALKLPGKKGACFWLLPLGQKGSWKQNLPLIEFLQPSWCYSWNYQIDSEPLERLLGQGIEWIPIEWIPMIFNGWGVENLKTKIKERILPLHKDGK